MRILREPKRRPPGKPCMDALHLACAEKLSTDVFLTTDDGLLKCAERNAGVLHVTVINPVRWILEVSGL